MKVEVEDDREGQRDLLLTIALTSFGCFKFSACRQSNLLETDMRHSHLTLVSKVMMPSKNTEPGEQRCGFCGLTHCPLIRLSSLCDSQLVRIGVLGAKASFDSFYPPVFFKIAHVKMEGPR